MGGKDKKQQPTGHVYVVSSGCLKQGSCRVGFTNNDMEVIYNEMKDAYGDDIRLRHVASVNPKKDFESLLNHHNNDDHSTKSGILRGISLDEVTTDLRAVTNAPRVSNYKVPKDDKNDEKVKTADKKSNKKKEAVPVVDDDDDDENLTSDDNSDEDDEYTDGDSDNEDEENADADSDNEEEEQSVEQDNKKKDKKQLNVKVKDNRKAKDEKNKKDKNAKDTKGKKQKNKTASK